MITCESGENNTHRLIKTNRKNNETVELTINRSKASQIKSLNNIDEHVFSSSDLEHKSDLGGNESNIVQEQTSSKNYGI
jgi:hypothetical protein